MFANNAYFHRNCYHLLDCELRDEQRLETKYYGDNRELCVMFSILEVQCSNLGPKARYPDSRFLVVLLSPR